MGVYINGMEMPKCCGDCFFNRQTGEGWRCTAAYPDRRRDFGNPLERPGWCPLIPVQSHGRLIDADALMKEFEKAQRTMQQHGREYSCSFLSSSQDISTEWYCVEDMLDNAPTIIPAEEAHDEIY